MDKGVDSEFKFIEPEEIDTIIRNRISVSQKGTQKNPWPADEIALRNSVIYQYMLEQGLSRRRCAEQISSRWGVSQAMAYRYIKSAFDEFAKVVNDKLPVYKEIHMERLESLLSDALMDHNGDLAARVLDQIAKCNGLYLEKKEVALEDGKIKITFD